METIRTSTLDEYISWYLEREAAKGSAYPIPNSAAARRKVMWDYHKGKMRDWFELASDWTVVRLGLDEFENLVFLESNWTKSEGLIERDGPDYRVLKRIARNAIQIDYLEHANDPRHLEYYDLLKRETLVLRGDSRIAVCSATLNERRHNPSAEFYILDGVGRSLPYMILVQQGNLPYTPVEAFLARRNT